MLIPQLIPQQPPNSTSECHCIQLLPGHICKICQTETISVAKAFNKGVPHRGADSCAIDHLGVPVHSTPIKQHPLRTATRARTERGAHAHRPGSGCTGPPHSLFRQRCPPRDLTPAALYLGTPHSNRSEVANLLWQIADSSLPGATAACRRVRGVGWPWGTTVTAGVVCERGCGLAMAHSDGRSICQPVVQGATVGCV